MNENDQISSEEKKMGKLQRDLMKGKETAERMASGLKKRCSWIRDIQFRAKDIIWEKNRSLMKKQHSLTSRTETDDPSKAYGLDMIIEFENKNLELLKKRAIVRHKTKQFYYLLLKSFTMNPTIVEIRKQFDDMWFILGSGGTPEKPASFIVTKGSDLPDYCFSVPGYKNNKNQVMVHFKKAVPWQSVTYQSLFGSTIDTEMERLRDETC